MLWWSKYDKKETIVKAMGVTLKTPITLKEAIDGYVQECEKGNNPQYWVTGQFKGIHKEVNVNKRLDALTIGEFVNADKDRKGAIQRVIRFAATGDINPATPAKTNGHAIIGNGVGNKNMGKFAFRTMPTADVFKLIPQSETKGRFGVFKLQIQEFVASLPKDQSATIDQPKNAHPKTIKMILNDVNDMLDKQRSKEKWKLYHNPLHEVFILTRNSAKGA